MSRHLHGSRPSASNYRPDIDGLRALAVLPVVFFHAEMGFPGGFVGVDIFFVISGYLITRVIYGEAINGTFSFLTFWERRIRRILPALLATVLAVFVTGWFLLLPDDFEMLARSATAQVTLMANIFFRKQAGYFDPASETKPLLHTWSLAVEEQFYIVLPVLLFVAVRYAKAAVPAVLILLICLSFGTSVYDSYHSPDKAFFFLRNRAWELLIGSLLAIPSIPTGVPRRFLECASWTGLIAILLAITLYSDETRFPGVAALLPCSGAALIIWSNTHQLTSCGRVLALKPFVFVGLISYSLYLWHWPLIVFARYWDWGGWEWAKIGMGEKVGLLLLALILATISWRWIETPFRARTILPERSKLFLWSAGALASVLILAGWVRFQSGMPERFSPEVNRIAFMKRDRAFLHNLKVSEAMEGKFVELSPANRSQPVSLVLWGDSHAMAIAPVLAELSREFDARGLQATRSATAPLVNSNEGNSPGDPDFSDAVMRFLGQNTVSNVLLAARWEVYPLNQHFQENMRKTVEHLQRMGIQVWIMEQVPAHTSDIPRAAARKVLAGRNPDELTRPLSEHREMTKERSAFFNSLVSSGVKVLDPTPFFVDAQGRCLAMADGKSLYADAHHLTVHGAQRLKPMFRPIFSAGEDPNDPER